MKRKGQIIAILIFAAMTFFFETGCSSGSGPELYSPMPNLTTLKGISLTPANPSIGLNSEQKLIATGEFQDGSSYDITNAVEWDTLDKRINLSPERPGVVISGSEACEVIITATYGTIESEITLNVTDAVLTTIELTPVNQTYAKGIKASYTATGHFSNGTVQDISSQVAWSSTDESVANFDSSEIPYQVTAKTAGNTIIKAIKSGITGQTSLTVSNAILESIEITPLNKSIPIGLDQQYSAIGRYSDGSTYDITSSVTWSSSDTEKAVIDNSGNAKTGNSGGSGLTTGTTTIEATLDGKKGIATLTVTSEELVTIELTPADDSTALGLPQQFTATGKYTNSDQDITSSVTWSSSDEDIIFISNADGTRGKGTTLVSGGPVTITAIMPGDNPITGTTSFTINDEELISISVTPITPAAPLGNKQQFTATGTFTNSVKNITNLVVWTSSNGSVSAISNADGTRGEAQTLSQGTTSITATYNGDTGKSNSTNFTVIPEELLSITVTPLNSKILINCQMQMKATGEYTNGTVDLTEQVTWSSTNNNVASISDSAGTKGLASNNGAGLQEFTVIKALLNGITGESYVMVTDAEVTSIIVTPSSQTIRTGFTKQFNAKGTCTDGSEHDITNFAAWSSSNTSVAQVDSSGVITGNKDGSSDTAHITATYNSVNGNESVTVIGINNINITTEPGAYDPGAFQFEYEPAICEPGNFQYGAHGYWSDGYSQDITSISVWKSNGHVGIYGGCDAWFDPDTLGYLHSTNETSGWSDWVTIRLEYSIKSDESRVTIW